MLLQKLCECVCDILLEESNVQPVSTPVTVCGDIHGQVGCCCVYIIMHLSMCYCPTYPPCAQGWGLANFYGYCPPLGPITKATPLFRGYVGIGLTVDHPFCSSHGPQNFLSGETLSLGAHFLGESPPNSHHAPGGGGGT